MSLADKKTYAVAALFSRLIPDAVSFNGGESTNITYNFAQKLPAPSGDVYTGRVVMLIDENAISQSESATLFFEAARPDIPFVSTPTAGANGDVTTMVLPGNIAVSFSGHSVRRADGRQLQRIGIQPQFAVAPTIRGLVAGKDEILEAAINYLKANC